VDLSSGLPSGRAGDIVVLLPQDGKYSIDASSSFGTLSSDFEGNFHRGIWSSSFERHDAAPARRIFLREGLGGIEILGSSAEGAPQASASKE